MTLGCILSAQDKAAISGNGLQEFWQFDQSWMSIGVGVGRSELCLGCLLGKLLASMIFTGDEIKGPFRSRSSVFSSYYRNSNLKFQICYRYIICYRTVKSHFSFDKLDSQLCFLISEWEHILLFFFK